MRSGKASYSLHAAFTEQFVQCQVIVVNACCRQEIRKDQFSDFIHSNTKSIGFIADQRLKALKTDCRLQLKSVSSISMPPKVQRKAVGLVSRRETFSIRRQRRTAGSRPRSRIRTMRLSRGTM